MGKLGYTEKVDRALDACGQFGERDFVALAAACIDQACQRGYMATPVSRVMLSWTVLYELIRDEAKREDPYGDEPDEEEGR